MRRFIILLGILSGVGLVVLTVLLILLRYDKLDEHRQENQAMQREVDRMFAAYCREEFAPPPGEYQVISGWVQPLPSGRQVHRQTLRDSADPVIALGPAAVPCLFKWAHHDDWHVRYIAIYSLEKITGIDAEPGASDKDGREKSIAKWRAWWMDREVDRVKSELL
jgi:hypothetical protein